MKAWISLMGTGRFHPSDLRHPLRRSLSNLFVTVLPQSRSHRTIPSFRSQASSSAFSFRSARVSDLLQLLSPSRVSDLFAVGNVGFAWFEDRSAVWSLLAVWSDFSCCLEAVGFAASKPRELPDI
ncbi:hypothetical protein AKJ16_DCAP22089 [Drosera capensis]